MKVSRPSTIAALAAAALLGVTHPAPGSAAVSHPITVVATIRPDSLPGILNQPGKVTLAPKTFKHGTVRFTIRNLDIVRHQFEIDGVTSRWMQPKNGVAIITVTFKKPGLYSFTCPDAEAAAIGGQVGVS